MASYLRNKRAMYSVSPMLGLVFFMITATSAAFIYNENIQQVDFAKSSFGDEVVFVAQAIEADIFDVLLQNYLQQTLDTMNVETTQLSVQVENAIRNTITDRAAEVYKFAYLNVSRVECDYITEMHAATHALFTTYASGKIIDMDATMEIKPIVSRYGVKCVSQEPVSTIGLQFSSRPYYLDAWNICHQLPAACW